MKKIAVFIIITMVAIPLIAQDIPLYLNEKASLKERVEDALSRMTLEEKVAMCHAQSRFSSKGVPRLGIPELWTSDGPNGVREELVWDDWTLARQTNDSCTAFPALTCLAATWNPTLAANYGKVLGEEARYRNKNVLLGPGINICRTPLNGRNFEYMGEDPLLISKMCVPYIQSLQSNGVAACVKHFALNNQELCRDFINVNVSNRALHEIYLPAFEAAVKQGKAWTIMGAYNKLNGIHCCHNDLLLNKILKHDWQFDGVVISDWGGTHDTYQAAEYGLDLEMGTYANDVKPYATGTYDSFFLGGAYLKALKAGTVSLEKLNDKVRRLLLLNFRTAMNQHKPLGSINSPEHSQAALHIAEEGIVLLKNTNNLLPLDLAKIKSIVVIGENANRIMSTGGGASGLKPRYEVTPLEGLKTAIPSTIQLEYAKGYDDKQSSLNADMLKEAIEIAKKADVVLFIGGLNKNYYQECEGRDRESYNLPYDQNKLISELLKVNKNIVFVNISGSAVAMPWIKDVKAILQAWYLGSEAGNAIANIITGKVNPSGKLPFSIPIKIEDCGAHSFGKTSYPGDSINVYYKEDILVGYRWYDTKKIPVAFSFGHGLSYTQFNYGKIVSSSKSIQGGDTLKITLPIKNIGAMVGSEVVQLYIRDIKSSVLRPLKELKSFAKVELASGEEKNISFSVTENDLQFFSENENKFVAEKGDFEILIGSSSIDIRQKIQFTLN